MKEKSQKKLPTSEYPGVYRQCHDRCWAAYCGNPYNGKRKHVGYFDVEEDAAAAAAVLVYKWKMDWFNETIKSISYPNEKWASIQELKWSYFVSTHGRVISLKGVPRLRKAYDRPDGYRDCGLRVHGMSCGYTIHRLVAKVFIPNTHNLSYINHKDFNRSNNHVDNLEWCTAKENTMHSFNAGRFIGKKNSPQKLTKEQVKEIKIELVSNYNDQLCKKLAETYGVTRSHIYSIKK